MIRNSINKLYIIILVLLILQAGLVFAIFWPGQDQAAKTDKAGQASTVHHAYFSSQEFYDEAYADGQMQVKTAEARVYGGIIPHHLIVKDKIAAFFLGLEKKDYETVVLVGPNHFSKGDSNIILSQAEWQTPYGKLKPDLELAEKLSAIPEASIEEDPFIAEHSISGLVGFVKKSLPDAKFVPVILRLETTPEESASLAEAIYNSVDPEKTLVIASVDFSHYMPTVVADFHDVKTNAVISSFDYRRVYDTEIDSPASIYTVLKYLDKARAKESELLFSTNAGIYVGRPDEPTTSHSIFYFTKGEAASDKVVNMLFFGDMMLDRGVAKLIEQKDLSHILENLAGGENRFFQGVDLISANLEGAVTDNGQHYSPELANDFAFAPEVIWQLQKYNFNFFNIANNHITDQGMRGLDETYENLQDLQIDYVGCPDGVVDNCSKNIVDISGIKVGLAGFSMVYSELNIERVAKAIKDLKDKTDFVVINIHWGYEYSHKFNQSQQEVAYQLIEAGADAIIGHHPHVVQGMELYQGKPIFYSLGNFIFDQYFSSDTQEGLAVGLVYAKDGLQLYLFPHVSYEGQVELMKGAAKESFLEKFLDWSSSIDDSAREVRASRLSISVNTK